jgi:thioredoxin 1
MSERLLTVTDESFASTIDTAGLVVVDFWAPWCGPCQVMLPVLEGLAEEYSDRGVQFAKCNIVDNIHTPIQYRVISIPALLIFKDGQLVEAAIGVRPKTELVAIIEKHRGAEVTQ